MAEASGLRGIGISMPPWMIKATAIVGSLEGTTRSGYVRELVARDLQERFGDDKELPAKLHEEAMAKLELLVERDGDGATG